MSFFDIIKLDLSRYPNHKLGIIYALFRNDGFRYTFWMRACNYSYKHIITRICIFPICYLVYRHNTYKFGCQIPFSTNIREGFFLAHLIGTVINRNADIGRNVNISQGVTIGQTNRGNKKGTPTIGDGVYIGTGAVIIGDIRIGNNVAIGANSVVTKDVPDNDVVVGIPAKVISYNGADGYINRKIR